MYAPLIQGDITIIVTGEVASAVIAWAELGHEHEDCWSLRDGTTTTDPQEALTDAVVVVAEDTDSRPWPFRLADDSESTEQGSTPTNTGTLDVTVDLPETFVRPLGRDEALTLLTKGEESKLPATRRRAAIILASNVGVTTSQIAALHAINTKEVQKVIAEFNERGIASVGDQ
jgi:hypothetical protein